MLWGKSPKFVKSSLPHKKVLSSFVLKMPIKLTQIRLWLGLCPRPIGEAIAALPQTPLPVQPTNNLDFPTKVRGSRINIGRNELGLLGLLSYLVRRYCNKLENFKDGNKRILIAHLDHQRL